MIAVPAWVWRAGLVGRAVILGLATGVLLGALVFAESGSAPGALVAGIISALFCGIMTSRRMRRLWPGAKELGGTERVAVVRAARSGATVAESHLASAVIDYSRALRDAAAGAHRYRWVVPAISAVALIFAVWDSVVGPARVATVSWLFVAILLVELLWWRRRQAGLLGNAERAEEQARALCPPARPQ